MLTSELACQKYSEKTVSNERESARRKANLIREVEEKKPTTIKSKSSAQKTVRFTDDKKSGEMSATNMEELDWNEMTENAVTYKTMFYIFSNIRM